MTETEINYFIERGSKALDWAEHAKGFFNAKQYEQLLKDALERDLYIVPRYVKKAFGLCRLDLVTYEEFIESYQ